MGFPHSTLFYWKYFPLFKIKYFIYKILHCSKKFIVNSTSQSCFKIFIANISTLFKKKYFIDNIVSLPTPDPYRKGKKYIGREIFPLAVEILEFH
jgi:hypothetical protein